MLSDADYPIGDLGKSLLEAARRGDEHEVRTLLTKGASFTTDWLGASPLHFAAQYGHLDTALLLMRAGMSWDARTKVNKTPLHIATQCGHEDLVRAFIAQGADVNAQDLLLMTPLHWAAQKNHAVIAEILLDSGADSTSENKFDKTPWDICIENGFNEIMEKMKSRRDCGSPASLYLEENESSNLSDSEKVTDAPSPSNLLSSLSSLTGISQDALPAATVSMDEIALLQSTPINFSTIPLESIRSIVLTDAGRLALQFLNKGFDNTILQTCPERDDNSEDGGACKIVSYKDDISHLDSNPEQYLTTSSQITTSSSKNHKGTRSKETMTTSDLLPSTSSGISLPPVFPDWNLRNNGDSNDNFELDLDNVLLHKQLDGSRHSIDIGGENLTVRRTSNGLQLSLSEVYLEKDLTLNLQVQPDLTLENFRAICSVEVAIPSDKIVLVHNGKTLQGDSSTLESHNVNENDVIAIRPMTSPFQMQGRPPGMPRIDFGAIGMPNPATSSRQQPSSNTQGGWDMNNPEALRQRFLNSPHDLALLSERNPAFADAIRKGGEAFAKHLEKVREAQAEAERHRIRLLAADPMDPEAQREIAEEIRQKNIQENMNMAIEEAPESFGQVLMLWINVKVNGHSVKAFVDSGAQMTIMSSKCAENCNIMRLVDKRWEGIAKGVGTQKIIGRIHLAQMQIENDFLQCSFSVLENQPMDVLLGLDMLRRHQCCIDLKSNILKIGTTGTETRFLHESELPTQNRLHTPSTNEGASTSTMETEDEQIAKALQESSEEAMKSESAGEGNTSGQKYPESAIKALTDMGLNRASAEAELQRCGGDVQRAIVRLLARSLKPQ